MRIKYVVIVFCMCCLFISGCSSRDMAAGMGNDSTIEEDMCLADAMSSEKENNKRKINIIFLLIYKNIKKSK